MAAQVGAPLREHDADLAERLRGRLEPGGSVERDQHRGGDGLVARRGHGHGGDLVEHRGERTRQRLLHRTRPSRAG